MLWSRLSTNWWVGISVSLLLSTLAALKVLNRNKIPFSPFLKSNVTEEEKQHNDDHSVCTFRQSLGRQRCFLVGESHLSTKGTRHLIAHDAFQRETTHKSNLPSNDFPYGAIFCECPLPLSYSGIRAPLQWFSVHANTLSHTYMHVQGHTHKRLRPRDPSIRVGSVKSSSLFFFSSSQNWHNMDSSPLSASNLERLHKSLFY